MRNYEYYKNRLNGQAFPFACLDRQLLDRNIQKTLDRSGDKTIRLATKSIRCPEVLRIILQADPRFRGLMTYHGAEALYLAEQGFDNLLMGYPVVDSKLLKRMAEAVASGCHLWFMVDHPAHLDLLDEIGRSEGVVLPVCMDLDVSDQYPSLRFGVWRSSIQKLSDVERFSNLIKKKKFLRLEALMAYEAQIAGVTDHISRQALKSRIVRWMKSRSMPKVAQKRQRAVDFLREEGHPITLVNGGGTGSLTSTAQEKVITEVATGSGFYGAHLFDNYKDFDLEPALFYGIPIVRRPHPDIYTCHGGGLIASGTIETVKAPKIHWPKGGSFIDTEGAGEVQTPIEFKDLEIKLQIGDPVFLRHAKSGELCERFNELLLLEGRQLQKLPTYRGLGLAFG